MFRRGFLYSTSALSARAGQYIFAGYLYPDILLVSRDRDSEIPVNGLGRYKRIVGAIINDRPVWEHEAGDSFVFSCIGPGPGVSNYWLLGPDPKKAEAWIKTTEPAVEEKIPEVGWEYEYDKAWRPDSLLKVVGMFNSIYFVVHLYI